MTLPDPENDTRNKKYASVGQTWMNIQVNTLFGCNRRYNNWRERQRGYLGEGGKWDILHANTKRPFFCVGEQRVPTKMTNCQNLFMDDNNLFQGGRWSVKVAPNKFQPFTRSTKEEYIRDIKIGAKLKYKCPKQKAIGFICVRLGSARDEIGLARCKKPNCENFSRAKINFNNGILRC